MINPNLTLVLSLETDDVPEWVCILPLGTVELNDGRDSLLVDQDSLEKILEAFAKRGTDLVVDYEHQTMNGVRAPAAGWIKELRIGPEGLWARIEWTEAAAEYIQKREYRYFSPVLVVDGESRQVVALINLALTNQPAICNIPALAAKMTEGTLVVVTHTFKQASKEKEKDKAMLEKLQTLFQLPEDATEDMVIEHIRVLTVPQVPAEILSVLNLKSDVSVDEVKEKILSLKTNTDRLAKVETELETLRQARADDLANQTVEAALKAGKLAPNMRDWAMNYCKSDPEGFKTFVAAAPQAWPKENFGPGLNSVTTTDFETKVEELVGQGKTRGQAIKEVARIHPDLHQQYLEELKARTQSK